jgi:hypothetical protein
LGLNGTAPIKAAFGMPLKGRAITTPQIADKSGYPEMALVQSRSRDNLADHPAVSESWLRERHVSMSGTQDPTASSSE